jgi:hypothetical protein
MNADEIHDGMNLELYYQWREQTYCLLYKNSQTRVQNVEEISEDSNIQDSSEQMDTVPNSRYFCN